MARMYARLPDLKTYLGIAVATTTDDALLEATLRRATTAIETYTGRLFEATTDTRYYEYDVVDGYELLLDQDLLSVTTLTNGDSAGTVIAGAYTLMPRFGPPYNRIRLKSATATTYSWEVDDDCWISVAGAWGFSATPPEDVIQACVRWAAYLYAQKDAQVFDVTAQPDAGVITVPQGIPKDVELLLTPYRRGGILL